MLSVFFFLIHSICPIPNLTAGERKFIDSKVRLIDNLFLERENFFPWRKKLMRVFQTGWFGLCQVYNI